MLPTLKRPHSMFMETQIPGLTPYSWPVDNSIGTSMVSRESVQTFSDHLRNIEDQMKPKPIKLSFYKGDAPKANFDFLNFSSDMLGLDPPSHIISPCPYLNEDLIDLNPKRRRMEGNGVRGIKYAETQSPDEDSETPIDMSFNNQDGTAAETSDGKKVKDAAYWEYRENNNAAARRSRAKRSILAEAMKERALKLERENFTLRGHLQTLQNEVATLRFMVKAKNLENLQPEWTLGRRTEQEREDLRRQIFNSSATLRPPILEPNFGMNTSQPQLNGYLVRPGPIPPYMVPNPFGVHP